MSEKSKDKLDELTEWLANMEENCEWMYDEVAGNHWPTYDFTKRLNRLEESLDLMESIILEVRILIKELRRE